jgi:voltage-gated potassium channel
MRMSHEGQDERSERVERALQWPMMALTIVFLIAVVVPLEHGLDPRIERLAKVAESVIWAAFLGEYLLLLALARDKLQFLRTHVLDAIVVVVPAFRVLRLARIARLARVLNLLRLPSMVAMGARAVQLGNSVYIRYRLGYILIIMAVLLLLVSGAMLYAEHSVNPALSTYAKCLWWGVVTMTTVGYGDASPVTSGGRALAILFMVTGIGLAGVVTATIASVFVGIERRDEDQQVHERLKTLETHLIELRAELKAVAEQNREHVESITHRNEQEAS